MGSAHTRRGLEAPDPGPFSTSVAGDNHLKYMLPAAFAPKKGGAEDASPAGEFEGQEHLKNALDIDQPFGLLI